jgi:peroxiredoxin family protein
MKMAIIATRGSQTSLVTLFTTVMVAAICEMSVRVLLRDEALYRLTRSRISDTVLSEIYGKEKTSIETRLRETGLSDLPALIREAKAQGDVRLFACNSSMGILGLGEMDLIEEIDEVRGLTSFLLEEISESKIILSL